MANRNFAPEKGNLQRGMFSQNGVWSVGATGAVTPVDGVGKTGMSLVRTGAGAYTLTTTDAAVRNMFCSVSVVAPSGSSSDGLYATVLTANGPTKTYTFVLRANNFTAADAPNGATLQIELRQKDSTV